MTSRFVGFFGEDLHCETGRIPSWRTGDCTRRSRNRNLGWTLAPAISTKVDGLLGIAIRQTARETRVADDCRHVW